MTMYNKKVWIYSLFMCLVILLAILPVHVKAAAPRPIVKVGILVPMKFLVGQQQARSAEITAEEINASGGVKIGGIPHDIMLVKADSNEFASVTDAVNAFERIVTVDKARLMLASGRSEASLAYGELLAKYRVIHESFAGHPKLCTRLVDDYEKYKYFFKDAPTNLDSFIGAQFAQLDMVLAHIKKELGIEKPRVALLMEKAAVSEPIIEEAKIRLPKKGIEIVGIWRPATTASDLTAEYTAIKDAGAHVVFSQVVGPSGNAISRQWGELEIPTALVGLNGEAGALEHWEATGGKCNYEVTINTAGRAEITSRTIPFLNKFRARFGNDGDWGVYAVHDGMWIWKEAVERAGTLDADAVVAEMEKTDYLGVQGRIAFKPRGDKYPHDIKWDPDYVTCVGIQWQDGKQVVVWPDGNAVDDNVKWKNVRYKGTVDYKLPPRMVEYWKTKKGN